MLECPVLHQLLRSHFAYSPSLCRLCLQRERIFDRSAIGRVGVKFAGLHPRSWLWNSRDRLLSLHALPLQRCFQAHRGALRQAGSGVSFGESRVVGGTLVCWLPLAAEIQRDCPFRLPSPTAAPRLCYRDLLGRRGAWFGRISSAWLGDHVCGLGGGLRAGAWSEHWRAQWCRRVSFFCLTSRRMGVSSSHVAGAFAAFFPTPALKSAQEERNFRGNTPKCWMRISRSCAWRLGVARGARPAAHRDV